MNELVREMLSLAEGEAKWLDDSARNFEQVAAKFREEEDKAAWDLLATVYRERAQTIQRMVEKTRESLMTDGNPELRLEHS